MTEMDLDRRTATRSRRWGRLSRVVSGSLGAGARVGAAAARTALLECGVPARRIHHEEFAF
jgi:hypothetical protein